MTKYEFQAEINQLLSLIINAFYSNKDVFLRELLSNASDALDKVRYQSLTDTSKLREFAIKVKAHKESNTLQIEDSGIGMSKEDMISCLGTIANSGTKQFMQSIQDGKADMSMIGQFGVGFYSAYLVAASVRVYSKSAEDGACNVWESTAGGSFTIEEAPDCDLEHGTRIVLELKEDCAEYLEETKLKEIITQHCQYLTYPIHMWTSRTETKEEEMDEDDVEAEEEGAIKEVSEEDGSDKKKTKTVEYVVEEWKHVNSQKPLWMTNPDDISHEEYGAFYKSISNDWEDHLCVKHFSAEGQIEFKALLYVPKKAPQDLFNTKAHHNNIKLYVKRVFIMDNCEDLMPEWLSFVSGVVDSEDLPLNVSREVLQQNNIMKIIKKNLVKKCVDLFTDLSTDATDEGVQKFDAFYEHFSKNIKLGIHEDAKHRSKLIDLLRFHSSNSKGMLSLESYVKNMKENQKSIYFITGENKTALQNSPFVMGLKRRGLDVLFMTDPLDEYIVQNIPNYDEKPLVNISKEEITLDGEERDEVREKDYANLCKKMKDILNTKVEKVTVSSVLNKNDLPCCVTSGKYGWSANMERIVKAQTLSNHSTHMQSQFMSKKNLEINMDHAMITKLKDDVMQNTLTESTFKDVVELMFETALVSSGYVQEDPSEFTKRVYNMIAMGIHCDEPEAASEPNDQVEDDPENLEALD